MSVRSRPCSRSTDRGRTEEARRLLDRYSEFAESPDYQARSGYLSGSAAFYRATGRNAEALEAGKEAVASGEVLGTGSQCVKHGLVAAAEAAYTLGELAQFEELLSGVEELPPGRRPAYLDA